MFCGVGAACECGDEKCVPHEIEVLSTTYDEMKVVTIAFEAHAARTDLKVCLQTSPTTTLLVATLVVATLALTRKS